MKSSHSVLDPRLAWALCRELTKLRLFLWDCYEEEFLKWAKEERARQGSVSEEDPEIIFYARINNPFDERARAIAWRPIQDLGWHNGGPLP